jgi:hypothetical protein
VNEAHLKRSQVVSSIMAITTPALRYSESAAISGAEFIEHVISRYPAGEELLRAETYS